MRIYQFALAICCAALVLLVAPVAAAPITGTTSIAGNVSVSGSTIDFAPTFSTPVDSTQTGSFVGITGGTIASLSGGPSTGSTFIPAFLTFSMGTADPIYFDLTYIAPGVGNLADCSSAAFGASCTPAGSPFTLFQLPSETVIAALQLNGNFYTGSSATGVSAGTAIFSTQTVIRGTIPEVVSMLQGGQTLSGITYSASFVSAPVPEPASLFIMSFGFGVTGLIIRRRLKASLSYKLR